MHYTCNFTQFVHDQWIGNKIFYTMTFSVYLIYYLIIVKTIKNQSVPSNPVILSVGKKVAFIQQIIVKYRFRINEL